MAKTANSVNPQRAKAELNITAAIIAALSGQVTGLLTAERIDISSLVIDINGGGISRAVNKQYVIGDDYAILDYSKRIEQGDFGVILLYTEGKDSLGTDGIDIGTLLDALARYTGSDLSLQLIYSLNGGNAGDEEIATSPTQSFITSLSDPIGGANTNERVARTLTLSTEGTTKATVS